MFCGGGFLMRVSVTPPGSPQSVDCQRLKGWRACFATPRQVAILPRHPLLKTRQVGFVAMRQNLHVNQADMGEGLRRVQVKEQLINELAAQTSVPDGEAFEFNQPFQMDAHLRQAPPTGVAQLPAAKGEHCPLVLLLDKFADATQQAAGLRRQFVQGAAQHFRRKLVRQRNIIEGDFNVRLAAWQGLRLALVLVQQGDGVNQRQVFLVVAPVAGAPGGEGQGRGVGIENLHRLQKPLRVAERFQEGLPFLPRHESGQRPPFPLHLVNAPGLLGALVHRQRQASVLQLLVQVNGRGGQEDHDRAFDVVFLRHHFAGGRVLAGAGNGQLAFALQELQGVAGLLRPGFLHDRKDFVLQIRFTEIVKALAGHGAILDPFLLREEVQHRVHQGAFPGGAGALDDDGQRPFQLARDPGQIGNQRAGFLADDARLVECLAQPFHKVGLAQPLQRLGRVPPG